MRLILISPLTLALLTGAATAQTADQRIAQPQSQTETQTEETTEEASPAETRAQTYLRRARDMAQSRQRENPMTNAPLEIHDEIIVETSDDNSGPGL